LGKVKGTGEETGWVRPGPFASSRSPPLFDIRAFWSPKLLTNRKT
jgi:hypothetical protein